MGSPAAQTSTGASRNSAISPWMRSASSCAFGPGQKSTITSAARWSSVTSMPFSCGDDSSFARSAAISSGVRGTSRMR